MRSPQGSLQMINDVYSNTSLPVLTQRAGGRRLSWAGLGLLLMGFTDLLPGVGPSGGSQGTLEMSSRDTLTPAGDDVGATAKGRKPAVVAAAESWSKPAAFRSVEAPAAAEVEDCGGL